MTDTYPIVPLAWLDGLHDLNTALETYHHVVGAWTQQALCGDLSGDPATFVAGLNLMFRPILDGYRDIYSQIEQAKDLGLTNTNIVEVSQCPPA